MLALLVFVVVENHTEQYLTLVVQTRGLQLSLCPSNCLSDHNVTFIQQRATSLSLELCQLTSRIKETSVKTPLT